jgi:hypothetical protein
VKTIHLLERSNLLLYIHRCILTLSPIVSFLFHNFVRALAILELDPVPSRQQNTQPIKEKESIYTRKHALLAFFLNLSLLPGIHIRQLAKNTQAFNRTKLQLLELLWINRHQFSKHFTVSSLDHTYSAVTTTTLSIYCN